MNTLFAVLAMILWSIGIALAMHFIGFANYMHDVWWSLGGAVVLLIGLIGNVWIFFLIAKETPWQWGE